MENAQQCKKCSAETHKNGSGKRFFHRKSIFCRFWGALRSRKIDPKCIFSGKWGHGGDAFIDFSAISVFPRFFGRFLVDFYEKINVFSFVFFDGFSFFLQPGDPHDVSYFAGRNAYFFLVFCFFVENTVKNRLKNGMSKKHPKATPSGTQKWLK